MGIAAVALAGHWASAQTGMECLVDIETIYGEARMPSPERTWTLDEAAKIALEAQPGEDIRGLMRRHGVYEGLILPVVLVDPGDPMVRSRWQMLMRDQVLPMGATHYGFARQGEKLAVVFVRRVFERHGLATFDPSRRFVEIRGALVPGYVAPKVFVARPDERVTRLKPSILGRRVSMRIPVGNDPGTATVEMVARGPRGMEVVALLTIDLRQPRSPVGYREGGHVLPVPDDVPPAQRLVEVINTERRRLGIAPLAPDPELIITARQHARNMATARVAAHVVPGGKQPAERLREAGIVTERFYENVALARTADQAHLDLWASPSHRLALLDPAVNRIGVGVARGIGAGGPLLYVVQHFARR